VLVASQLTKLFEETCATNSIHRFELLDKTNFHESAARLQRESHFDITALNFEQDVRSSDSAVAFSENRILIQKNGYVQIGVLASSFPNFIP